MRIGDGVPLPEPETKIDKSSAGEDSTSQDSVQSIRSKFSEDQLAAISESSPGDESAKSPQLLDNLAPDTLEPHRPENMFEDLVKIDVFSNVPGNVNSDLNQGLDLANLTQDPANPTKKDGDRHYLGGTVTGAGGDALKNALGATGADGLKDAMNLNPTGSQNTSGDNVPRFRVGGMDSVSSGGGGGSSSNIEKEGSGGSGPQGPTTLGGNRRVGGRDMSLVGASTRTQYSGGGSGVTVTTDKGTSTFQYDAAGKATGSWETSTEEGVTTDKSYDADGKYQGKFVTSANGKVTFYDKNGNEKYDTGEGETVFQAPTAEEFLRIKNFGGGYTDPGRPELQSDAPMEKDPAKARGFGVIDVNPDYTEETTGSPNLGNIPQPDTRPELEGPELEMPPTPGGNPNSNDSN